MPTPLTKGKCKTTDNLWYKMPPYVNTNPPGEPQSLMPTPEWIENEAEATVVNYANYLNMKKAIPTLIFVAI